MRFLSIVQALSGSFSRRNTSSKLSSTARTAVSVGLGLTAVLCSTTVANAQGVRLDPTIITYAGNGSLTNTNSGNGGLATAAGLNNPEGIAYDSKGLTYIADYNNNTIRTVNSAGIINAFAGTGTACTTVIAGADTACGDGGPASAASFNTPTQMQFDTQGNLYIADFNANRIRKITATNGVITPASIITTVAGTGTASVTGNTGLATAATLNKPHGLALDSANNLYIGEQAGCVVQYVPAANGNIIIGGVNTAVTAGHIYTIAGQANNCGYISDTNGTTQGTASQLNAPTGISLDSAANIYIGDYANGRVRKLTRATGVITTVAGTGQGACPVNAPTTGAAPAATPVCGDGGLAAAAALNGPTGVYVDSANNIIIGDAFGARVRQINGKTGIITTLSGTSQQCTNITQTTTFSNGTGNVLNFPNCGDGTAATKALVSFPILISVNPQGNILYVDQYDNKIREIVEHIVFPNTNVGSSSPSQNVNLITTGSVNTIITSISVPSDANGTPEFTLGTITGCTIGGTTGNVPNTDCTIPVTFNPAYAGVQNAPLVVVTNGGTFQFGLTGTGVGPQAVISPGTLSTVAGTGTAGATGNGAAATAATLTAPRGVTLDPAGNFFIADTGSNQVRKVTAASGTIAAFAGGGAVNYITAPGGLATLAALNAPQQVALDSAGNAYITDFGNHTVARVDAGTNAITVFAGTGTSGNSGDGGPATSAQLAGPSGIVIDPTTGNTYIADATSSTVRLVNPTSGLITTFAGTGVACASSTATCGDGGAATAAQLSAPTGLLLDANDNLYISDTGNNRIRKVNVSTGVITTVVGTGAAAYTGDGGTATSATLNQPSTISLDAAGDLYITDKGNNAVRFVTAAGVISTIAGNGTACTTVPSPSCGDGGSANVSAFSAPVGLSLDSNANLYVADTGTNRIRKITTNPTKLAFPPAPAIGVTQGPLTATLYNIGNATLTYTTPTSPNSNAKVTTTNNPTTGTATPFTSNAFVQTNATTCGPIFSTSATTTLASGANCNYVVTFTPDTAVGNYVGTLVETDNSLNSGTGNALYPTPLTQTINLTGSAVQGTVTVLLGSSVNPSLVGQSVTLTATVSGGGVPPTGTVTFTYTPAGSTTPVTINAPATLSTTGGVTTATVTTTALPLGTDTVTATYNGDTNYVAGTKSSTLAQVVNQVSGTTDKVTAATASISYGTSDQLTFSIPVTANAAAPAGTVLFSAGTTALGSATWPATPVTGTCPGGTGTCYLLTDSAAPTNIPVGAPTTVTAAFTATNASGYASASPTTTVTVAPAPLSNDSLSSAPNPTTSGTSVTVTFFIPVPTGNAAPTGTVSFSSPGATFSTPTALTPATVNGVTGYSATATSSNLPVGTDTITGTLTNTDPNYVGGSLTTPETITQVSSAGQTVTAATASITYGTSDQLTYAIPVVANAAVPAGTVAFTSGTTNLGSATWPATPVTGTCPSGTGTCYLLTDSAAPTNIPVGAPSTITAKFTATTASGYASGAPTTTVTVTSAPISNDSLTSAPTPTTSGTVVTATFFIPVPAGNAAPTGGVTFSSPGATFSAPTALTATTQNGVTGYVATATSNNLPVGTDTITGTLSNGDPNYAGGSLTTTEVIAQVNGAAEKVSAATATITYGTADQLTYSIPVVPNAAVPAGTVTFSAGTTALGSATWPATPVTGTCPGGTGACYLLTDSSAPTNIPVGAPTTVTGTFVATATSGYASAAPTTTVTVNQAPVSADSISASPNPATSGSTVTVSFFIPVPAGDAAPTGPVTFSSPGATFSTPSNFAPATVNGVVGYVSTATTTNLPTGTDTITGTYTSADPNYAGGPLTTQETINVVTNTGDAVTASPSPTTVGSSTTLTFTIPVVSGAAVPTGSVAFTSGTTALGTATWPATPTIVGGNYVLTTTTTALPLTVSPATSTPITATYTPGTTSGYGAASPTTTDVVNQVPGTADAVTPANTNTTVGSADALTFSIPVITGVPVPAGTVTFTSGTTALGTAIWPGTPTVGTCPTGTGNCYLLVTNPAPTNIPLTVAPATSTPITATFAATGGSGYASSAPTNSVVVTAAGGAGDTLTVANNPTTFGTADTLTFNIPATSGVPAPTGTVVFTATGGVALGTATWGPNPTVTNGNYSLSISPTNLPVGAPTTVTAAYTAGPTSGYGSASPIATVTVNKVPVLNDGISANPSATTSGQTVTLSFTVPNVNSTAPANTATVTFTAVINGVSTTLGTANLTGTTANGTTTYTTTTTALPVGNDTVTGTFTGDSNYAAGALTTPVAISSNNTSDSVVVVTNPTTVASADTINFLIPVTTGAALPTGTVVFTSGTTNLGTATWPATPTVTNGNYVLSISTTALPLTVAPSTSTPVLATYTAGPTSGYASTSTTTTVVVNQVAGTGDAVTVTNNPTVVGSADPITFSIPVVTGVPVPAGSVTFASGTTALGTATWPATPVTGTCPGGTGTCYLLADSPTPTNLPLTIAPATSTPVTATYTATSNSGYASAAPATTVVVTPAGSGGDTLTVATNPTVYGTADQLTFSIPVSSGVPVPAGTVVFTAPGGITLGTATWPASPAQAGGNYILSISPTNIPVGAPTTVTSTFTASPASGYASAAPTATVTVNKVPTSNDGISANPSATTSGQTVTLTFTVPNVNSTPPASTATVTFSTLINGVSTTLGTGNLVGTTANGTTTYTTTTTALPVGTDTITGTFAGDTNYAGGALTTNVTISPNSTADTVAVATNPTTVASADTITFSIPVATGAAAPAGTVVFTSGTTALGTATWPATPTITGGNYTLSISTTALPLTIAPATNTPVQAAFTATGASGYASATANTTVVVNQVAGTNDAVTAANAAITVGSADALTFSIPVVTGVPAPVGTVAFTSGTTNLGSATWPATPATGVCPGGAGTCYLLAANPAPSNIPLTVAPATSTPITAAFTAAPSSGYASSAPTTAVTVAAATGAGDTLTVSNNPTTFGTSDTLTFSIPVASGVPAPAGTVVFTAPGGIVLGTATWPASPTVTNGNYSLSISTTAIPVGAPTTVTATYTATVASGYGSATPTANVTVNKVPVSNDGISATPSATTSGQTVTLSFTVPNVNSTAPANASTVTFTTVISGTTTTLGAGAVTGTTANGVTTYTTTTTALPVGSNTITGTFTGDTNYAGGALTTTVAISSNTTTDTVTVATNPTTVGAADTITFTVPVATGAAVPAGTVTFTSGSTTLGTATWPATPTVTNGSYNLSISTTTLPLTIAPAPNTPVLATFAATGASGYASTTASTTVVVNQVAGAGDAVTVTNNPTTVGSADPITFSIPVVTGVPAPSGTVTFASGTTNLGSVTWPATPVTGTCPGGSGTCYILADSPIPTGLPLTVAPATSTPVTATFTATPASGYASASPATTVVVNPAGSGGDTLTVANNPTTFGTADTLTFSIPVSSGVPAPAGTVVFTAPGGVTLGTATWPATPTQSGGSYILSISPTNIPVGAPTTVTSTFTASAGSGYASAAPTATVTVNKVPTSNDGISANPSATTSGQTVTLSFTVPNVNSTAPANTSTVTFTTVINGVTTTLGTANVTGTTANGTTTYTTTTTALPVGTDVVTGTFTGDGNYAGGALTTNVAISSNVTSDLVTVATNPTTVASPDTITFSIPVTSGAAAPAGTVVFTSGTTTLGTATWPASPNVTNGNYTLSISTTALPLTVAPSTTTPVLATFTATGASGYSSTTATTTVVVNQISGATDQVTAADSATTVGTADPLTFSIPVVTGAPVPTGTVTFASGTTSLGSATWPASPATGACPGGVGSCYLLLDTPAPTNLPLTVAPATSTPVTATYTAGPTSGYASTTATTTVLVQPVGGTGGTLTVANNPTTVGAPDTLTFTLPVNTGAPAPAGTVIFTGGGVTLGTATWPANATPVNGFYTISIAPTNIPLGNPTQLTATFSPSAGSGYGASAPTASVTVTQIPGTGDALTSNPNPSIFGQTVTLTETVPTVNGITPTGTVTFSYNGTQIGTGTITNGVVTVTTSTLPVGSDLITATYTGDANYAPVTDTVTQVVNVAAPPAILVAGPNPATFGQTVTLTETLTAVNGVCPPGPVTFFSNGTQIGTPATVNAQCVATITTNTLPVGSDAITATAPASGSFAAVTSGPVALVINKANGPDTLTSNPNPSTFGQNVTLTDTIPTVAGTAPTGTVNFYDFGVLIGTGTVDATGVATLVTSTLPVGTDSITAVYQGDGNYAQITAGPVNQVVSPVAIAPTLTVGPNPTTFGTPVTVTETIPVINGTPATGTVIFSQNGIVIGTGTINAQGVASFTTNTLPVGTDPITATYSGDTNYSPINSGPVNELINKANGPDTLAVNPDPSVFGNTVTITDTVPTVGGVAPTGTVTFTNNGVTIGTAPIVNGVATLTTTTLPVGSDPISAAYSGDNNYAPVTTGPVNEIITTGSTIPVLGASPNPTTFGTPVTLTESIPGINGIAPTGSVQFFNNGVSLGTATVVNGVASLTTSTLPIGTNPITAQYSGDTNYGSANSGPLSVVVTKAAPVDTLVASPNPTTFGAPVTLTFTVPLINGVVPTGLVTFSNGTTVIGTANVNASGVATIQTSNLPVGSDLITAKYPGDNTYAPASPNVTEVVGLAPGTGDTLTTNPNPSTFGQIVTLTETLPTVGGVAPTGTVTFFNNGAPIGTATVTNGVATLTTTALPQGTDPITATYSGDGNYATVTSGPVQQVVNAATGGGILTVNPNPSTFGTPVTLTETIAPINGLCPNGPATFSSNGAAIGTSAVVLTGGQCVATITVSTLPVGTDQITATVPASNGFGPTSSGPVALVVGKATGVGDTLTSSPNPSVFGETVTLTEVLPTVNGVAPTGTVTFTYNGTTLGTATVANGIATISTGTLPAGTDPITATYTGDANYAPVTSGPVQQVVTQATGNGTLVVGPNPSTFGTPVTLTETITPINGLCPAGPATFLNNGTSIGTGAITLTNGNCVATLTTSTLPTGTDSLTATVPASGSFGPITTGPVALVVGLANGPDTLAANPNPTTFGTNVTLTDTIPTVGGVAPTGTVNFYDFGVLIGTGTVTNGVATLVTGTLPVGTDSITAVYQGDSNYAPVTAGPVNEVVSPVPTVPTLTAGPNPTTFGTPVTLTETFPLVNGTPATGIVTFLSNGTVIGTGTINAQGVASITTSTLPVGTDSITATYPGDSHYAPVTSGPVAETINKANGPDQLTVAPDPGTFGSPVTITDTIPTVGGVPATGTVNFYDNGTLIGTGTVVNGVATLTTSTLPVGSDPITAVYSGDNNYAPVTTGPVNEVVFVVNPTPALGATPNPATFGTTVTLTESIPGVNGVTPTGTVNFYDNGTLIGTATLKNGVATLTTGTLPIGTDPITATYSGDGNYGKANSGPLNVVINQATPTDTLTSSPANPALGQPVTLTFTVPIVNGVVPTGVVTFYNGTTVIGTGTINSQGIATITTSTLPPGTTTITAKYPGDNTYAPSSPTTTVTVGPGIPVSTITTNIPNGTTPGCGTSVTLTDTLTLINGVPTSGTVQFYNNGIAIGSPVTVTAGGVATFSTTTLPCGATNKITAVFTPTPGSPYAPSNGGPISLPVSAPDFAISASPANQVVNPGDSATYTVSLSGVTVPFNSPVTLTATCNCQGITISFANPTITPGQGPTNTTMTIVTSPTFAMSKPAHGTNNVFYGLLLLPLLGLGGVRRKLRKLPKGVSYCLAALLLLGGMGAVTGCGGGYYGPPVKVCTITITGTSGNISHSTTVNVTVR